MPSRLQVVAFADEIGNSLPDAKALNANVLKPQSWGGGEMQRIVSIEVECLQRGILGAGESAVVSRK
jgi:hypothetical protein